MSLLDKLWCLARGHEFSPSDEWEHIGVAVDECDRCGKQLIVPAQDKGKRL